MYQLPSTTEYRQPLFTATPQYDNWANKLPAGRMSTVSNTKVGSNSHSFNDGGFDEAEKKINTDNVLFKSKEKTPMTSVKDSFLQKYALRAKKNISDKLLNKFNKYNLINEDGTDNFSDMNSSYKKYQIGNKVFSTGDINLGLSDILRNTKLVRNQALPLRMPLTLAQNVSIDTF